MKTLKVNCAYDDLIDICLLIENVQNPKIINASELAQLKKEIVELGFFRPQIINDDNVVLGGNQRLKALRELAREGYDCSKVPVSYYRDKEKEDYVVVADNTTNGQWNQDVNLGATLEGFLKDVQLKVPNFDIGLTGLSPSTLSELKIDLDVTKDNAPAYSEDDDVLPEVETKDAVTQSGDLWELGRSVYCPKCGKRHFVEL